MSWGKDSRTFLQVGSISQLVEVTTFPGVKVAHSPGQSLVKKAKITVAKGPRAKIIDNSGEK